MTESGLAAVHAAANNDLSSSEAQSASNGQQKENLMADTKASADATAGKTTENATTLAELRAAYPDLTAQLETESATKERSRIIGIESLALPGHSKLIADMKADPSVTKEEAAVRLIQAENLTRKNHLQAISDIENENGKPPAAPTSDGANSAPKKEAATTPEGLKAEWEASAELQAEFPDAAAYVALKQADKDGRFKVLKGKTA